MHKKGISLNSVEKSLSHNADKIRGRTLLGFQRILVSKSFKQRREEASRFCRNFLSHMTETKSFVKEPFCFWGNYWFQKVLWMKRGVSRFFVENFWSHSAEKFRRRTLQCVTNFGYRKLLCIRRGITIFLLNFFLSHSAEKLCIGTL